MFAFWAIRAWAAITLTTAPPVSASTSTALSIPAFTPASTALSIPSVAPIPSV